MYNIRKQDVAGHIHLYFDLQMQVMPSTFDYTLGHLHNQNQFDVLFWGMIPVWESWYTCDDLLT